MIASIAVAAYFVSVIVMVGYIRHLCNRIDNLQCELFEYARHEYVMHRFTSVWSQVIRTQDDVKKLQAKRGGKKK